MKQLANHVSLFSSHDDIGYLTKYVDPVQGLDIINNSFGFASDWIKLRRLEI